MKKIILAALCIVALSSCSPGSGGGGRFDYDDNLREKNQERYWEDRQEQEREDEELQSEIDEQQEYIDELEDQIYDLENQLDDALQDQE